MINNQITLWIGTVIIYTGGIALFLVCLGAILHQSAVIAWRGYAHWNNCRILRDAVKEKCDRDGIKFK